MASLIVVAAALAAVYALILPLPRSARKAAATALARLAGRAVRMIAVGPARAGYRVLAGLLRRLLP